MKEKPGRLLILLATAWLLAGCARTAPVAYYQLTALPGERPAAASPIEEVIGLGPLTLPEYLDRPQIVSRRSANQLQLADRQRWAEPLGDNIARVLQENLAVALGSERVVLYPWSPAPGIDRQITVEILHCEAGDDDVQFEARWMIQDREGRLLLPQRRSSQRINVAGTAADYERQVAALSEALARFSTEIAAALREIPAEPNHGDKP